jgi:hypothetical protein
MTMHDLSTGRGRRPLRRTVGLLPSATIVLSVVSVGPITPGLLETPLARAADPEIQPRVPGVPGVAALSR